MTTWILVLFVYTGPFSHNDSMAITNIPGFKTREQCVSMGNNSMDLVKRTVKELKYVCLEQVRDK